MTHADEVARQRAYYDATAASYDQGHASETPPFALCLLDAAINYVQAESLLDIGSGTGRIVRHTRGRLKAVGVEPVASLRAIGHSNGLREDELIEGDALKLPFAARSVDVVTAFAVLHHIRDSHAAVSEMLRVARKAVFICDANNFGQGKARRVKQVLHAVRLWRLVNLIKTRGRGYIESAGDGISYPYSVFQNLGAIRKGCRSVHLTNISGDGENMFVGSDVVAVFGLI